MLQVTFKSCLRESPLLLDSFVLSSFDWPGEAHLHEVGQNALLRLTWLKSQSLFTEALNVWQIPRLHGPAKQTYEINDFTGYTDVACFLDLPHMDSRGNVLNPHFRQSFREPLPRVPLVVTGRGGKSETKSMGPQILVSTLFFSFSFLHESPFQDD